MAIIPRAENSTKKKEKARNTLLESNSITEKVVKEDWRVEGFKWAQTADSNCRLVVLLVIVLPSGPNKDKLCVSHHSATVKVFAKTVAQKAAASELFKLQIYKVTKRAEKESKFRGGIN